MKKKMVLIGGLYMERNIKCKPNKLCMIIFMLCLSVRFVEYFLIETDKTAIGENVLHKVVGIILLALVLKKINLTWGDACINGFVSESILRNRPRKTPSSIHTLGIGYMILAGIMGIKWGLLYRITGNL